MLTLAKAKLARSSLWVLALVMLSLATGSSLAAAAPVTIKVWMMGFPYANRNVDGVQYYGIQTVFEEFERQNPGVKIEYQDIGWDNTFAKIMTSMIGEGPDVYMLGSTWVGDFVLKGTLENLDPYIAKNPYPFDKFHERYVQMSYIRDRVSGETHCYGLPWVADCRILGYDKAIFDHYKVPYPTDDMTWEDFVARAKATTGTDPVTGNPTYGFMLKGADPTFPYMAFLYQNGGSFYNAEETRSMLDSPEAVEALEFVVDLHRKHDVCGPETMNNKLWNTFGSILSPENKYAMFWSVPAMVKAGAIERRNRIGICTLPVRKGTGGLMGGSFVSINRKSANKDEAFKFISFLGGDVAQQFIMKEAATLSPRSDLMEWDFVAENPEWKVPLKQFAASYNTPITAWGEAYNIIGEHIQNALIGAYPPAEAVQQMAVEVDHLLKNNALRFEQDPREVQSGLLFLNLTLTLVVILAFVIAAIWGFISYQRAGLRRALSQELLQSRIWYLFISPVFLLLIVFLLYPLIESLRLSFLASDGINITGYVGLDNYEFVMKSAKFWNSVSNTVFLTLLELFVGLPLALVLSVLINEKVMGKTWFKVIYFMPVITSYVAISIVWELILHPGQNGILNSVLRVIGIAPLGWISDPDFSKPALAIMDTWRWLGFITIVLLAGLQSIPEALYEAARIDGAKAVDRFFHVTLPMLRPSISFVVLTHGIGALQMFDQIYVLGGERGGVQRSFQSIVSYLYEVGFVNQHFGVASAIAYVLFFLIAIMTAVNAFILKPHKAVG
jgi:multiple sugar transport system permease protein